MKKLLPPRPASTWLFAILVLLVSASFSPAETPDTKVAKAAVHLSISALFNGTGDNSNGNFTSSGFLNTRGTTVEVVRISAGTFHAQTTFTDRSGTFTATLNGQYTFTGARQVAGSGNWVIVDGAGKYQTLHGTGNMTFTADFDAGTINDEWTGDMHYN